MAEQHAANIPLTDVYVCRVMEPDVPTVPDPKVAATGCCPIRRFHGLPRREVTVLPPAKLPSSPMPSMPGGGDCHNNLPYPGLSFRTLYREDCT